MKKLSLLALVLLACGPLGSIAFTQEASRFPITFEMDGKKVETSLTLRIKQNGKLTEIKYSPTEPLAFPQLAAGERFDLWVVTNKYVFPFLDMHPDALKVSGWRIGIDRRPFHLGYMELKFLRSDVKLVYYMIYQHSDGGETPIWFESRDTLETFRK